MSNTLTPPYESNAVQLTQNHTTSNKNVNKSKTKKEVERILAQYKKSLTLLQLHNSEPAYDSHKPDEALTRFIRTVKRALFQLTDVERLILHYRYIEKKEIMLDYLVMEKVYLSESSYYRMKPKALLNLAYLLQIEVMK